VEGRRTHTHTHNTQDEQLLNKAMQQVYSGGQREEDAGTGLDGLTMADVSLCCLNK